MAASSAVGAQQLATNACAAAQLPGVVGVAMSMEGSLADRMPTDYQAGDCSRGDKVVVGSDRPSPSLEEPFAIPPPFHSPCCQVPKHHHHQQQPASSEEEEDGHPAAGAKMSNPLHLRAFASGP